MALDKLKKLSLPFLHTHIEKELAALKAVEKACYVFENENEKLKNWFIDRLKKDDDEGQFFSQFNRDQNISGAVDSLTRLLAIYKNLKDIGVTSSFDAYILIHDLAKPLMPAFHDRLISDIMSRFDQPYHLWEHFGVINSEIKHFYNLALRYHHILGVMIIGELSYLVYDELFKDKDFQLLKDEFKNNILEFLMMHAALDSSAIDKGYLSKKKIQRYFDVVDRVQEAYRTQDPTASLQRISQAETKQRIIWLLSSHDHDIDIRPDGYYEKMLTVEAWNDLLQSKPFIAGFSKIRQMGYGAKFLYSLAHNVSAPSQKHDIHQPAVGAKKIIHFLKAMAVRAVASDYIVEIHFDKQLQTPDAIQRALHLLEDSKKAGDILINAQSHVQRNIEIIRIGQDLTG